MNPHSTDPHLPPPGYRRPGQFDPSDKAHKMGDFIAGMFGLFGLQVVLTVFFIISLGGMMRSMETVIVFLIAEGIYTVGVVVWARGMGRPYIARGYLSAFLILGALIFLLFGICSAMVGGMH